VEGKAKFCSCELQGGKHIDVFGESNTQWIGLIWVVESERQDFMFQHRIIKKIKEILEKLDKIKDFEIGSGFENK
jgi:hypothetical protein